MSRAKALCSDRTSVKQHVFKKNACMQDEDACLPREHVSKSPVKGNDGDEAEPPATTQAPRGTP